MKDENEILKRELQEINNKRRECIMNINNKKIHYDCLTPNGKLNMQNASPTKPDYFNGEYDEQQLSD
jgi:hypothetical protein